MNYRDTAAVWPISLAELQERRGQYKRKEDIFLIIWAVAVFLMLASYGPLTDAIAEADKEWFHIANNVGVIALVGANLAWLIVSTRHRKKACGLQCPNCQKLLNSHSLAAATATGRCRKCEAMLVKDHPNEY